MKERDDKYFQKYTQAYWSHRVKANSLKQKKNIRNIKIIRRNISW